MKYSDNPWSIAVIPLNMLDALIPAAARLGLLVIQHQLISRGNPKRWLAF
jgi:hypothetical protein